MYEDATKASTNAADNAANDETTAGGLVFWVYFSRCWSTWSSWSSRCISSTDNIKLEILYFQIEVIAPPHLRALIVPSRECVCWRTATTARLIHFIINSVLAIALRLNLGALFKECTHKFATTMQSTVRHSTDFIFGKTAKYASCHASYLAGIGAKRCFQG